MKILCVSDYKDPIVYSNRIARRFKDVNIVLRCLHGSKLRLSKEHKDFCKFKLFKDKVQELTKGTNKVYIEETKDYDINSIKIFLKICRGIEVDVDDTSDNMLNTLIKLRIILRPNIRYCENLFLKLYLGMFQ